MNPNQPTYHQQIQDFVKELSTFALTAEAALEEVERDMDNNKNRFSVFSEKMVAIRGTAQQLKLDHIARFAEVAEEIAVKGTTASARREVRKCVGALWDALTTIKHLLEHYTEETSEEQMILSRRLEDTLRVLGGARVKISSSEIDQLLKRH